MDFPTVSDHGNLSWLTLYLRLAASGQGLESSLYIAVLVPCRYIFHKDSRTVVRPKWIPGHVIKCKGRAPISELWGKPVVPYSTLTWDAGWGGDALATESGVQRRKMRSKEVTECFVPNQKLGRVPAATEI